MLKFLSLYCPGSACSPSVLNRDYHLENIQLTGKAPKIPKTFNQATGKFSTWVTGFNDISMGEITCKLLLITLKLRAESYDKIVVGAMDIAKKTRKTIHTDEVIDLTTNGPPEKFTMIVDIPSDDENETMDLEDVKIKDENEEIEISYEYENGGTDMDEEQEQDTMEDEYGEIEDNEDQYPCTACQLHELVSVLFIDEL